MRSAHKKNRPYNVKKTGLKDENIDRQILAIHKAIGEKLIKDHAQGGQLLEQVQQKIEQRYQEGRMHYGEYITWNSAIEQVDSPEIFLAALLEDTPKLRKWRRRTPFVGVLTEEERQHALSQNAVGEISIETLY